MAQAVSHAPRRPLPAVLGLCVFLLALCAGCATSSRPDSDLPWNMQQPWESAPAIPGFNRQ
jgi:hypothetical protein